MCACVIFIVALNIFEKECWVAESKFYRHWQRMKFTRGMICATIYGIGLKSFKISKTAIQLKAANSPCISTNWTFKIQIDEKLKEKEDHFFCIEKWMCLNCTFSHSYQSLFVCFPSTRSTRCLHFKTIAQDIIFSRVA